MSENSIEIGEDEQVALVLDEDGDVLGAIVDDVVVVSGPEGSIVDETIDVLDDQGNLVLEDETVSVFDADANLVGQEETVVVALDE